MHQKFMTWKIWQRKGSGCHHILEYQHIDYFTYLRNSAPLNFLGSRIVGGSGSGKPAVSVEDNVCTTFYQFYFTASSLLRWKRRRKKIRKKWKNWNWRAHYFLLPFLHFFHSLCENTYTNVVFLDRNNTTRHNTRPHTTQNKTLTIREGSIFSFQLNPMSLENNKKVPSNGNDSYPWGFSSVT